MIAPLKRKKFFPLFANAFLAVIALGCSKGKMSLVSVEELSPSSESSDLQRANDQNPSPRSSEQRLLSLKASGAKVVANEGRWAIQLSVVNEGNNEDICDFAVHSHVNNKTSESGFDYCVASLGTEFIEQDVQMSPGASIQIKLNGSENCPPSTTALGPQSRIVLRALCDGNQVAMTLPAMLIK